MSLERLDKKKSFRDMNVNLQTLNLNPKTTLGSVQESDRIRSTLLNSVKMCNSLHHEVFLFLFLVLF